MIQPEPRPRIAIVGSGISGLAAAWLLGDAFHVTVFERRPMLGLGAEGQEVDGDALPFRVDIPPRVFNAGHYRSMMQLLSDVEMPTYEIRQAPCYTDEQGRPYLGFKTFNGASGSWSMPRLHPHALPWLVRHGARLYRWHRFVQQLDLEQIDGDETLGQALKRLGFDGSFRDSFLYPMWALMCTCRYEHLDAFPARPVLELARNFAGEFTTLRFKGGTRGLEKRLQKRIDETALGRTVTGLAQHSEQVRVHTAEDPDPATFDHVILATDPNSTQQLLAGGQWSPDGALIRKVPVFETTMVLHTDTSVLPNRMRSPVNLHYDDAQRRSSATILMNAIEHEQPTETLLQSWDPMTPPAGNTVKAHRVFKRALMNQSSQQAMTKLRDNLRNDQARRVWYVGSYVEDGVPLLENGVRSARLVTNVLRDRYRHGAQSPQRRRAQIA